MDLPDFNSEELRSDQVTINDFLLDDLEFSSSQSDYQSFESAFVQRFSESRLHRAASSKSITRSEGKGSTNTTKSNEIRTETSESGSESSGWVIKQELSLRRRSGSEGNRSGVESNFNMENTVTMDQQPEDPAKKRTPQKELSKTNLLSHSSSVPNLEKKNSITRKSKSKIGLTPKVTTVVLPKTNFSSESDITIMPDDVRVSAPALLSPKKSSRKNHQSYTLSRNIIAQMTKSNQLNKESHPALPFTSWEEDGALRPPKNKIFGGKKNSKKKKSQISNLV